MRLYRLVSPYTGEWIEMLESAAAYQCQVVSHKKQSVSFYFSMKPAISTGFVVLTNKSKNGAIFREFIFGTLN